MHNTTKAIYVFSCGRWLATDEDDGKIDRILYLDMNRNSRLEIAVKHEVEAETEQGLYKF